MSTPVFVAVFVVAVVFLLLFLFRSVIFCGNAFLAKEKITDSCYHLISGNKQNFRSNHLDLGDSGCNSDHQH